MIPFLTGIGGKLLGILAIIGAALLGAWRIFNAGQSAGAAKIENLDLRADKAASAKAAEVRRDVRALGDDGVAQQLRDRPWRRK